MPERFVRWSEAHSFNCIFSSLSCFACVQIRHPPLSGGYCGGVPPLPIPNREVKPTCADGTAMQCGRVGSCLLLKLKQRSPESHDSRGRFPFFVPVPAQLPPPSLPLSAEQTKTVAAPRPWEQPPFLFVSQTKEKSSPTHSFS